MSIYGARKKIRNEGQFIKGGSFEDPLNLKSLNEQDSHGFSKIIEDPVILPPHILNLDDPLNLQSEINKDVYKDKDERTDLNITRLKNSLNIIKKDHKTLISLNNQVQNLKYNSNIYVYGNYPSYYKYRNKGISSQKLFDPRLVILNKNWIYKKMVLDVGCNSGVVTRYLARVFKPLTIVGIDIDQNLIKKAKYDLLKEIDQNKIINKKPKLIHTHLSKNYLFPLYSKASREIYPNNITFQRANYIFESKDFLDLQLPEFEVVLFLSISKWIHLNWGDVGLILTLQRIFYQLKEGGIFIFEPQDWPSYKKAKKKIKKNYSSLKFRPQNFKSYLLNDLGYAYVKAFHPPTSSTTGFERTIYVYVKLSCIHKIEDFVKQLNLEGGEYSCASQRISQANPIISI